MKLKYLVIALSLLPIAMMAQETKVGVRAGLDFSTLVGPQETHESSPFSTGFHFGINVSRYLSNTFGIRAELLYQQKGFRKEYDGVGYYPLKTTDGSLYFEQGDIDYVLEVSNAYVSIPITAHIQPLKQLEFFAGVSANFLINPVGSGNVDFISIMNPDDIFYRHTLQYSYYQDSPGDTNTSTVSPQVFVGEDIVTIPGSVGAYYIFDESFEDERTIKSFDVSLVAGTQLYVNKGFYIGLRAEYGLRDITNDILDVSLESTSETGGLKFNDDKDQQLNFEASVGFRF